MTPNKKIIQQRINIYNSLLEASIKSLDKLLNNLEYWTYIERETIQKTMKILDGKKIK